MTNKGKSWKTEEIKFIERNFYEPNKILAKILNRSKGSIVAQKVRIKKTKNFQSQKTFFKQPEPIHQWDLPKFLENQTFKK
jgi:hypothetical protein